LKRSERIIIRVFTFSATDEFHWCIFTVHNDERNSELKRITYSSLWSYSFTSEQGDQISLWKGCPKCRHTFFCQNLNITGTVEKEAQKFARPLQFSQNYPK
jgi:hypothetical protein